MFQIPTVEISYSKVHKGFREETKVHSTKKDNNPEHPTSKKKVFLIPDLMIRLSLSTGHKHVGHLKKTKQNTHTFCFNTITACILQNACFCHSQTLMLPKATKEMKEIRYGSRMRAQRFEERKGEKKKYILPGHSR